jgi:O-antigen ligase
MRWNNKYNTLALVVGYALIRVASYFLGNIPLAQGAIAAALIGIFSWFCWKSQPLAWILLVGEILLDGAGHFFEFNGLLLRTWWLAIFATIWIIRKFTEKSKLILPSKQIIITLAIFIGYLIFAIVNGLWQHHTPMLVAQDAILYLFILLLFPALDFDNFLFKPIYKNIIKAFIWTSALFSAFTLWLYSSGLATLPNGYYQWFRNIAAGKITDLGENFFRIVLPEHLLIVPIFLILVSYFIYSKRSLAWWLLFLAAATTLALNFTRIYFVGIAAGLFFLLYHANFKRWLTISSLSVLTLITIFFSLHFVGSDGRSLGLNLLGVRLAGMQAPLSDPSGAIRMAMLPDILNTIKKSPWLGSGLGTTVSYIDPTNGLKLTRTQFDWGYWEMIAELGIIGTVTYLIFLIIITYQLFKTINQPNSVSVDNLPFSRGLVAGAIALFVINITTPALFQGFGVIYFVFLIKITNDASRQSPPAPLQNRALI